MTKFVFNPLAEDNLQLLANTVSDISDISTTYLQIDGSNANVTIDIGSEDFITTGDLECANITLIEGDARVIKIEDRSDSGDGYDLSILAGLADTTGNGGDLSLVSGKSPEFSGKSGAVSLISSVADDLTSNGYAGGSGNLVIKTSQGASATVAGGSRNTGGTTGSISITTGNGGAVSNSAGNEAARGSSGGITIRSGTSGAITSGYVPFIGSLAGNLSLYAGNGGKISAGVTALIPGIIATQGGQYIMYAGNGSVSEANGIWSGNGGGWNAQAGQGGSCGSAGGIGALANVAGYGGSVTFQSGIGGNCSYSTSSNTGGRGGSLGMYGGNGGSASGSAGVTIGITGEGGDVNFRGGYAGAIGGTTPSTTITLGNGGDMNLSGGRAGIGGANLTGAPYTGGLGGDVNISGGAGNAQTGVNSNGGLVYIIGGAGHGTGNDGDIYLGKNVNSTIHGNIIMGGDNTKIYFGTEKDASIYYDNTDLWINSDEVGTGSLKIGDATNYTEIKNDGEINLYGTARVYVQCPFIFNYSRITGQGKPTLINRGMFFGFSLPVYSADDEELFACICMPEDWDGTSDPVIYLGGWLDTANNTKKFQMRVSVETADFEGNDVVPTTSNDYDLETTTGNWAQYTSCKCGFTIDASTIGLVAGQPLAIRIRRIAASANEIAGEVVIEGALIRYKANKLGGAT